MNKYREAIERLEAFIVREADEPLENGYHDHTHLEMMFRREFEALEELVKKTEIPLKWRIARWLRHD